MPESDQKVFLVNIRVVGRSAELATKGLPLSSSFQHLFRFSTCCPFPVRSRYE